MINQPIKIYLCGYIGGPAVIDKCIAWRREIVDYYTNYKENKYPIIWMDPLDGKNLNFLDKYGLRSNIPSHAIIHRDYQCVVRADLLIANMDTFGEERPLIGSVCEIAWAWDKRIPVIMITENPMYIEHPFTEYMASHIVKSVQDLIDKKIINYYHKGWSSHISHEKKE
jgi:hypothetical protein